MTRLIQWLAGATLLVLVGSAAAQVCRFDAQPTDAEAGERLLQQLRHKACLGSPQDKDELTSAVRERLGSDERPGGALALPEALSLLLDHARSQAATGALTDEWRRLAREIERVLDGLPDPAHSAPADYMAAADRLLSPKWSGFTGSGAAIELDGRQVQPIKPVACDATGACDRLHAHQRLVRALNLMTALQDHLQRPALQLQLAESRTELARWQAYRRDSQHQYFWELWFNGRQMAKDPRLCARDGSNGLVGFCKVPTSQWVLLHPDAGLRWSRRAKQSSELEPALVVDLIGRHFLRWENDSSARIAQQWGYSLAASYSKVGNKGEWAFGPRVQYQGYNLALTRGPGGHWGVVINLNLATRYFERKADYADALQSLRKPDLLQLLRN